MPVWMLITIILFILLALGLATAAFVIALVALGKARGLSRKFYYETKHGRNKK